MNCIQKYFKKRRLLAKYKVTPALMREDLHLLKIMEDDKEFRNILSHIRACEIRCYNRLKKLKP